MVNSDKGVPFLTGGNLKDGHFNLKNAKYITKEKHNQLQSGHLKEDDIVIAVRGSLGELGYVTKQNIDWNINSQLAIIRTFKEELNGNFLLYFFLSSKGKSRLLSRQTGTALKQLPLQQLKTIIIPKIQILEQQKISDILNVLDKVITLYERKVRLYKLIFKKAINSIVNVSSSSEISLGNIFDVITDYVANGSFKSLRENVKHYSSEEYAYLIRLQDFNNHWKGPWLYTDKKGFDFLKKSKLQTGDIILSNVGSVGKIFQVPSLDKPMTLAPNSILLKTEKNNEDYMYYLMLSSNFQRKLKEKVTPGVQEKINKTDLKKIKIKLPSKNQQDSIAELLKTINSYIKHLQQKASYLKDIKKELLNTMFI